jgi:hypothetical protein
LLFLGENAFLLEGVLLRKCIIFSILGIWMATKDTDDRPVAEQLPAGGEMVNKDISRQRRKIIKASAAAIPAIMTLRSGAAAAMNSSYQCFNHGENAANVDRVIGDGDGIPHDEWLRLEAKPGKIATYTNGPNTVTLYGIRKNDTTATWDDYRGWNFYDDSGQIDEGGLFEKAKFLDAWPNAVEFYCVPDEPSGLTCISEQNGAPIILPTIVDTAINASTTLVKLLCYYNPDNGDITYYPNAEMPPAHPITESCMCSIRPISQLLG